MVTEPTETPVTTPVLPTVAIDTSPDDQVPPETELDNVMVLPVNTDDAPDIVPAEGAALIVTTFVAVAEPQAPKTL